MSQLTLSEDYSGDITKVVIDKKLGDTGTIFNNTVLWCLEGRNILALRKKVFDINEMWSEVVSTIDTMGLSDHFDFNKTSGIITCKSNKAIIMFKGLSNINKIKSISVPIYTIVMEEANEFTKDDLTQLKIRRYGNTSKVNKEIFLLFSSEHNDTL